jgi:hypothetical protein
VTEGRSQSPFHLRRSRTRLYSHLALPLQPCLHATAPRACQDKMVYPWPSQRCLLRVGLPLKADRAPPDAVFFRPYGRIAGANLHHPPSGPSATSWRTTQSPWCSPKLESAAPNPIPRRHHRASPPESRRRIPIFW